MVGLPLSFFLVCVPQKRARKHMGTLEWKIKSSSFGNGSKILGA